jgi:outer membrane protein OmpA-like peptidoglycan-associated protein
LRWSGVLILSCLLVGTAAAAADPSLESGRLNARAGALGGADAALPGGAEALFVQPAALAQLRWPEIAAGFGAGNLEGERQFTAVGAVPLGGRFVAGLGGAQRRFAPETGWTNTGAVWLGLGFPLSLNGRLLAGVSGKYLEEYVPGLALAMSGGGVDLALRYDATSADRTGWEFGLSLLDVQTVLKGADREVQLPTVLGLGGQWRPLENTLIVLAYDGHFSSNEIYTTHQWLRAGAEEAFAVAGLGRLYGRLGYAHQLSATGRVTGGLGVESGDWRVDYAVQADVAGGGVFHQLACSWGLQREVKAQEAPERPTPENAPAPQATPAPTSRLFSALDAASVLEETPNRPVPAEPAAVLAARPRPEATPEPQAEEAPVYHLQVPPGPADQERTTLAPELEVPGTFSSYIANLKNRDSGLRIEDVPIRLAVVVNPFSPGGRKPKTMFVGRVEDERLRVSKWVLNILQGDSIIRTYRGGKRLPYNLEWDGTDERGRVLSDGTYDVLLRVFDENGLEAATATQPVVIRTRAVAAPLDLPAVVALTGSEADKPVVVGLPRSPRSNDWQFVVFGPNGKKVFERSGGGEVPDKVTWPPRVGGRPAPEGAYSAVLTYYDEAGVRMDSEGVFKLTYAAFAAGLGASPTVFQPAGAGGQGVNFAPSLDGDVKVRSWTLTVREAGVTRPVREFSGAGRPPDQVVWDGKDAAGQLVPGGRMYRGTLRLVSTLGTEASMESPEVQSDLGAYTGKQALTINLVRVTFSAGAADLGNAAQQALAEAVSVLKRYPTDYQLRVLGHCADQESPGREAELSRKRAQAVTEYFVTTGQIPAEKIQTVGYGSEKPLSTTEPEKNRSVEVVLYAK